MIYNFISYIRKIEGKKIPNKKKTLHDRPFVSFSIEIRLVNILKI